MEKSQILDELAKAKERIEFLEKELTKAIQKEEKFEFNYPFNNTFLINKDVVYGGWKDNNPQALRFGLYRINEDNAIHQLNLNKESNLIGAIVEQINSKYLEDIKFNFNEPKYCILYDHHKKIYKYSFNISCRILGVNYMSKDLAEKVCEILNKGLVQL